MSDEACESIQHGNTVPRRDSHSLPSARIQDATATATTRLLWQPIAVMFLLTLVSDIGYFVSIAPQTRLYEDLVCRRYYSERPQMLVVQPASGDPEEAQCKVPGVQDLVAELLGMQIFFDSIIGILFGICFGALADRIGRRPVLTLSTTGVFFSYAWRLIVCKYCHGRE